MPKTIDDIVIAISRMDNECINVVGVNSDGDDLHQAGEHVFTAELYYHAKTIVKSDTTGFYDNLQLHFDLKKPRFGSKRPDLVLHRSPKNRDDQRLYIEIKTCESNVGYGSDIEKLLLSVSVDDQKEQLGYENAAFIVAKNSRENVKIAIYNYAHSKNLVNDSRFSKIYLIHLISPNDIYVDTIENIINDEN